MIFHHKAGRQSRRPVPAFLSVKDSLVLSNVPFAIQLFHYPHARGNTQHNQQQKEKR